MNSTGRHFIKGLFSAVTAASLLLAGGCGSYDTVSEPEVVQPVTATVTKVPSETVPTVTAAVTTTAPAPVTTTVTTSAATLPAPTATARPSACSNVQPAQNEPVNEAYDPPEEPIYEPAPDNSPQQSQGSASVSISAPKQEQKAEPEQPKETFAAFDSFSDYTDWANETGYHDGSLTARGSSGAYTSGSIVIGDSRCCQLGIYQQRTGGSEYAAFAVWGGHFASGISPSILNDELLSDVESCFRAQIDACGSSTIYLFATVNDYDFYNNSNSTYIRDAVRAAERLSELSYDNGEGVFRPLVIVVGFDGCWTTSDLWGTPQSTFNRYVSDYNTSLQSAVNASESLAEGAGYFTTVPDICGGKAGFIDDGLHYSDDTLESIAAYITG